MYRTSSTIGSDFSSRLLTSTPSSRCKMTPVIWYPARIEALITLAMSAKSNADDTTRI
ncbi:Uncharacterised protein [Salmonella enterica subsp. enterica serovar Bovismorbificans]|uniref:Uncharacterized protein n=1 Tax=Salmonella enterica subsp. enterica serovar Bovismorbificans TaxID=58097 RepID=A0A655D1Q2_SALET|nr:Uncharacterised protein [Salmonella enterica subsp. enterica serovar Bovismorbificans]CPR71723.1 Uncharacterised protein [Salmonella enterica subsp. enterica serovar Bovismorbificans]